MSKGVNKIELEEMWNSCTYNAETVAEEVAAGLNKLRMQAMKASKKKPHVGFLKKQLKEKYVEEQNRATKLFVENYNRINAMVRRHTGREWNNSFTVTAKLVKLQEADVIALLNKEGVSDEATVGKIVIATKRYQRYAEKRKQLLLRTSEQIRRINSVNINTDYKVITSTINEEKTKKYTRERMLLKKPKTVSTYDLIKVTREEIPNCSYMQQAHDEAKADGESATLLELGKLLVTEQELLNRVDVTTGIDLAVLNKKLSRIKKRIATRERMLTEGEVINDIGTVREYYEGLRAKYWFQGHNFVINEAYAVKKRTYKKKR